MPDLKDKELTNIRWTFSSEASPSKELVQLLTRPEGVPLKEWFQSGQVTIIKSGPHRTVYRVQFSNLDFYLKHNRIHGLRSLIREWGRPPKAFKEFQTANLLKSLGIPAVEPFAYGKRGGFVPESFLVTNSLQQSKPLDLVLLEVLKGQGGFLKLRALLRSLAKFIAHMHFKGVMYKDFHLGNLVISEQAGEHWNFFLVDLESISFSPSPISFESRLLNLAMLDCWAELHLPRTMRLCFWKGYLTEVGKENLSDVFPEDKDWMRFQLEQEAKWVGKMNLKLWKKFDQRCLGVNRRFRKIKNGSFFGSASTLVAKEDLENWVKLAGQKNISEPVIKNSRTSLVMEISGTKNQPPFIFKKFKVKEWLDPITALMRPDAASRSWTMGHAFLHRLLPTPKPVAMFHKYCGGFPLDGFLVAEKITNARDLSEALIQLSRAPQRSFLQGVRMLIDRLGNLIRNMHDRGISHRDLKAPNLLVTGEPIDPQLWFIDLVGVRLHALVVDRNRMQNLARLNVSFLMRGEITHADRLRFLRQYLRWGYYGNYGWKKWWRKISDLSLVKMEKNRQNNRPLA